MTTRAQAVALDGLLEHGCVRESLLISLLRELATNVHEEKVPFERACELLDDPILLGDPGKAVIEDVQSHYADPGRRRWHAGLCLSLGRSVEARRELVELLLDDAMEHGARAPLLALIGDPDELRESASQAFQGKLDLFAGQALLEADDVGAGLVLFSRAADRAREIGHRLMLWHAETGIVACCHLSGRDLDALVYADRTVEVARELGEPERVSKSLGDIGYSHMRLQQFDVAREAFEQALAAARDAGDVDRQSDWLGNLGNVELMAGELEAAERCHREALALSRERANRAGEETDLNHLANVLWVRERPEEAITCLLDAITIDEELENHARADQLRQLLLVWYRELGQYTKAKLVEELLDPPEERDECGPASAPTVTLVEPVQSEGEQRLRLDVQTALRASDLPLAEQYVAGYIAAHPDDAIGYFVRGWVAHLAEDFEAAIDSYEQALQLHPDHMASYLNMVNSCLSADELDPLRERLERQLRDNPYHGPSRIALGRLLGMQGEYEAALAHLDEACNRSPECYPTHVERVVTEADRAVSLLSNDWSAAWAAFERCAGHLADLVARAQMRQKLQSLTLAGDLNMRMAQQSQLANPSLLESGPGAQEIVAFGLALSYYERAMKEDEEAQAPREKYGQIIDLMIGTAGSRAIADSVETLVSLGAADEAFMFLSLSDTKDPDNAETQHRLGQVLLHLATARQQPTCDAVRVLERAVELEPDNLEYRGTLAAVQREYPDEVKKIMENPVDERPARNPTR